jgi:hypothetical protein
MRIDRGRLHVTVTQQLLNRADIGSSLKKVGGEGMTKSVCADLLCKTSAADRRLDGLVDDTGINMMATDDTRAWVNRDLPSGKNVLPASPNIGPLRVDRVMVQPEHPADFVEKPRRLDFLWTRRRNPPCGRRWAVDNDHRAKLPENPPNIILSGQKVKLINGWAWN